MWILLVLLRIGLSIPLEMWGIDGMLPLRLLESLMRRLLQLHLRQRLLIHLWWDLMLMWLELRLMWRELRLHRRVLRLLRLVLRLMRLHLGQRLECKVLHTRPDQSLEWS